MKLPPVSGKTVLGVAGISIFAFGVGRAIYKNSTKKQIEEKIKTDTNWVITGGRGPTNWVQQAVLAQYALGSINGFWSVPNAARGFIPMMYVKDAEIVLKQWIKIGTELITSDCQKDGCHYYGHELNVAMWMYNQWLIEIGSARGVSVKSVVVPPLGLSSIGEPGEYSREAWTKFDIPGGAEWRSKLITRSRQSWYGDIDWQPLPFPSDVIDGKVKLTYKETIKFLNLIFIMANSFNAASYPPEAALSYWGAFSDEWGNFWGRRLPDFAAMIAGVAADVAKAVARTIGDTAGAFTASFFGGLITEPYVIIGLGGVAAYLGYSAYARKQQRQALVIR